MVIGQRDFISNLSQGPGPGFVLRSDASYQRWLWMSAGNLYVVDAGNNRIVRYPNPFNQTTNPPSLDLVIGQKTQSSGNSPMRDS